MPILIGMVILTLACVFIVVLGINHIFPNFFKMRLKRIVDIATCVFGLLSPFALIMMNAAALDIYRDYLSAPLFSRFKTALPSWYVWDVHSCHGEWGVARIGFNLIIIFNILLFARFVINWVNRNEGLLKANEK
jgi:hypothetical protein